jgi:thioredoxin-like negative regulator of GroEL
VIERIADERAGTLKVATVNVDEEPSLADLAGVHSIPFLVLYRNGEPAARAVRAHPKHTIERVLGLSAPARPAP